MKKKTTTASEPEGLRQRLTELRLALLKLHKALVDSERVGYEKTIGKIQSPNHFLQLAHQRPVVRLAAPAFAAHRRHGRSPGRGRTADGGQG